MTTCDPSSPLWCYVPNKGAAYAFAILYFLNAVGHWYQCWKYKAKYTIPLAVGATFTTVGFCFKIVSSYHLDVLGLWIPAAILLFTAPPIYSAADYFVLAKTLHYIPSQAPMHPGRVVTTFVTLDTLCEMLMGTGVGQVVNYDNPKKVRIGTILIKCGLILQILLFLAFVAVAFRFHSNVRKANLVGRWTTVLYVLYTSAFVISVRCLYRVVEYFMGTTGPLFRHEAYFHVFEATLMLINVLVLNFFHPARFLPKSNKIFLNENGQEESADRGGWDDKRPFFITLVDPFNLVGLLKEREEKKKRKDNAYLMDTKAGSTNAV
ncbi:hypothetical protein FRB91_003409 [Serendipita sp. 411]|nr:hypothetical protein FRC18_010326 [Serendipita sp. 400]KAG8854518.1 hypothetical protein FRB91_003409 [Serendipita sp. 411]